MGLFYDYGELLSKNGNINFLIGGRGCGKTFGFKEWAIRDFLKTKKQFVYLRRYKEELAKISTFFVDIQAEGLFPKAEFKVEGGKNGAKFYINNQCCGYAAALSSQVTLKSVPFNNVNKLCFDEFLLEKSHYSYLPNEPFYFMNIIETVSRLRIGKPLKEQLRVFAIGNPTSIVNPYFDYFNIYFNPMKRFDIYDFKGSGESGRIVLDYYKNDEFEAQKRGTALGAIMGATSYGDYAIAGNFYLDNDTFIEKHPQNIPCVVSLKYKQQVIYFWFDYENALVYASAKGRGECKYHFSLTASDHQPNYMLLKRAADCPQVRVLLESFKHGCMRFDNQSVKQTAFVMFQKLGVRNN